MSQPPSRFAAGPRRLMRQIRSLMAGAGGAQERLDAFVRIIAANFVSEVCSIYLRRSGGQLELFATEGLDQAAVHATRLAVGEGLVGWVAAHAQPLNVVDARAHPAFSYQPQTGEDAVASFLGAPILRGGRTLGVLTIQNRVPRRYDEEEVETLQTVAMVLAEVVVDPAFDVGVAEVELRPSGPERLVGRAVTDGVAIGVAAKIEPHVASARLIAEDPAAETERLAEAAERLRANVDALLEGRPGLDGPPREVLETFRMIAHDGGWLARLQEAARAGLTAEAAVERVRNEQRARLLSTRDVYLQQRLHDIEDLANRMLRHLADARSGAEDLPEQAILFARTLGPGELLELDPAKLRGVVLEEGAAMSHAAIVARALGVPMVGGLGDALDRVEAGDPVIVDGGAGEVHVRPTAEATEAYEARIALSGKESAALAKLRDVPAKTKDARRVTLMINAGLSVDLAQFAMSGADGIGLFRTEFQFLVSERMPRQAEQIALYARALEAADGREVIFRTLDLGGDKILPYLHNVGEENPAMGWRALRMALDRPGLLRYQLRALFAAAQDQVLSVMFPLVTTAGEFREARALVERELAQTRARGRPAPDRLRIGAMLEAPSLAFQLDALLDHADFVSIGANDLMQFFFAADRDNARLADRYDALSASGLLFLKQVRDACAARGKPVSVCGEIAGRPLEALALMALGYERLSMPVSGVGRIKRLALSVDLSEVEAAITPLLASKADSLREPLGDIAARLGAAM